MRLYQLISMMAALLLSDLIYAETVWIDVRSADEYQQSHIEGDLHIPYQSIVAGVEKYSIEKNTPINLYCRSGGRAGKAKKALEVAGYTDVNNAGGIDDVRKQRKLPAD